MSRLSALLMATVGLVVLGGCSGPCPKIDQLVVLPANDSSDEIKTLIDACQARQPGPGETCPPADQIDPPIACGCKGLCQRVLEIIDQFAGPESLEHCWYIPPDRNGVNTPNADAPQVHVIYRPSSCP